MQRRKHNQIEDLTGQKFGLLTVTGMNKVELDCEIRTGCNYICECGAMGTTIARYLKRGSKNHCGDRACKRKYDLAVENNPNPSPGVEFFGRVYPHEDNFGRKSC